MYFVFLLSGEPTSRLRLEVTKGERRHNTVLAQVNGNLLLFALLEVGILNKLFLLILLFNTFAINQKKRKTIISNQVIRLGILQ